MKIPIRGTHRVETAQRITAPDFRKNPETKRREPLICWADESSNHRRDLCTAELFKASAGENEVGEKPDGLDRLVNHMFVIHFDASDLAIGMDVIPTRQYGGRVVPEKQRGVDTLKLQYSEDGSGIVRVIQHPVNTRPEVIRRVIQGLDAMAGKHLKIGATPVPGNAAKIVSLNDGVVELKLSKRARRESVHANILEEQE